MSTFSACLRLDLVPRDRLTTMHTLAYAASHGRIFWVFSVRTPPTRNLVHTEIDGLVPVRNNPNAPLIPWHLEKPEAVQERRISPAGGALDHPAIEDPVLVMLGLTIE